ncbi:MAG: hypothetical protein EOO09_18865 [Chitinophagaceae bacterium]|nr:MAG: hypothetical protein EOO09_18865 [Chitinophagaceae bacterium]
MKLRLQEIELDTVNPRKTRDFYDYLLKMDSVLKNERLSLLNSGTMNLDFTVNEEHPSKLTGLIISTSNLLDMIHKLDYIHVPYKVKLDGDRETFYIEFTDPDGSLIQVHEQ